MESQDFTNIPGGLKTLEAIRKADPENFYDYLDPDHLPSITDCVKGDIVASQDGTMIGILDRVIAGGVVCLCSFAIRAIKTKTKYGKIKYEAFRDILKPWFNRMATSKEVKILREVKKKTDKIIDLDEYNYFLYLESRK